MSDYTPSKYDHLFEGEPWTEIAKSAGIAPGHTEAQARRVASVAADEITRLRSLNAELAHALERTRDNFIRLLEQKPVRDAAETLSEADRALSRARAKEDT